MVSREKLGSTGPDYADQRFYTSQFGRFMIADRFKRAAKVNDSGSWNKYSYTRGDPVNHKDPQGLFDRIPEDSNASYCDEYPNDPDCQGTTPGGGSGNGDGDSHGGFGGPTGSVINPFTLDGFTQALSSALGALATPDCAKHFGLSGSNAMNPSSLLTAAANAMTTSTSLFFDVNTNGNVGATTSEVGTIVATSDPWAYFSSDGVTRVESTRASIDINVASWNSGSAVWRAQALIHELGHVFNMLLGAGGSDFVFDALPNGNPNPTAEATNLKIVQDCIH